MQIEKRSASAAHPGVLLERHVDLGGTRDIAKHERLSKEAFNLSKIDFVGMILHGRVCETCAVTSGRYLWTTIYAGNSLERFYSCERVVG